MTGKCIICRAAPATYVYDDWGPVYCCAPCGRRHIAEAERIRPAPNPRILTPIDEGLIPVTRGVG